jgi:Zn-dependent protease with chaperone function
MRKNWAASVLSLLFLIFLSPCRAQQRGLSMYVPDTLVRASPERLATIKERMEADLTEISTRPKQQREYIASRFHNRYEFFKSSVEEGDFLLGGSIEMHLQEILNEVLRSYPSRDTKIQLFISRSTVPNAYCTGDNNIIFNVGLLNKLDNDAEVAFVLCHELAHQYLEHTKKGLVAKAEKYTDKEFQKNLNKTLKEEYNVKQKLENLIMPGLLSDMSFSRQEELEADSAGFVFFSATRFDKKAAFSTIEKLDSIDLYYDRQPLGLAMVINCPGYPWRSKWEPEVHHSSLAVIADEKDTLEDSLKTHPDCKVRMESIRRQFARSKASGGTCYLVDSSDYRVFRMQAEAETVNSMFLRSNMGRMMFYAYHCAMEYPENLFSRVFLSFGFSRLNRLQKAHKVNTEFPLPVNSYEVNYNKMLNFLNNLNREETASLGYYLLRPVDEPMKKYEDYLAALAYSAYAFDKSEEYATLKNEYLKSFPKGKYINLFTSIN